MAVTRMSFNPLTGISSILTNLSLVLYDGAGTSFNPLTGISSILTYHRKEVNMTERLVSIP